MHGIKRTPRPPEELLAERKKKEQAKIVKYTGLQDAVFVKKRSKEYTEEAFALTAELLGINPEFYTVWNYRRNILLLGIFPKSSPLTVNIILKEDLQFTLAVLKHHPKVYWIWNHRRWCLENLPLTPDDDSRRDDEFDWRREAWTRELFVVEKMLDSDSRNFQAWNYRRYVLASLPPSPVGSKMPIHTPATEIAYTQQKIEANFSNFSAWHQRSKVYELTGGLVLDREFNLVNQAMYTMPDDQSAWLYHRWLVSHSTDPSIIRREIKVIENLLEEEPDSKWCLESIIKYTLILKETSAETRIRLISLVDKLIRIDPMRKGMYEDVLSDLECIT